ncbi:MAG: precorrin-2 dehydrogenase/sirohydrochlorin ferrochelatase family protein, partial [Candidatus Humimicrobiaceae bacterium]
MKKLYPVYLNITSQKCLVVGGGDVAERKIKNLLECGARVMVVSPECNKKVAGMVIAGEIKYHQNNYQTSDLEGAMLVISAADSEDVNRKVAEDCLARGILVNVVDSPDLCNFFIPSVIRRGDLAISISTGGKSPLLAVRLRMELEKQFGKEYEKFLEIMGRVRQRVLAECDDPAVRNEIFQRLIDS